MHGYKLKPITLTIVLALFLISIAGCESGESGGETVKNVKQAEQPVSVSLKTEDGAVIKGLFYPNSDSEKSLILLHQFNKDKSSWSEWIPTFQKTHNVLAIDLRGHGESSGVLGEFTDEDFKSMQLDVKAAQSYLERQGLSAQLTSLIGASIGANTVQNYVTNNPYYKAVLLSPGINYKGIELSMQENSALVIVSKEDAYSYNSVKQLEDVSQSSEFVYLENKGHGTNMLDQELVDRISKFLNS